MTTRNPASASAQGTAAAAHLTTTRIKTDAEFYDSLEYDRTRYTEDIAVAARVFLIAVRNALRCDPVVGDLDTTSAGRADLLLKDKNKAASAASAASAAAAAAAAGASPAPAVVTSSGTGTASASASGSAPATTGKAVTSSSAAAAAHAATQPAVAAPRTSSGSNNNNADRKNNATSSQADGTARGTKRPAPGPPSRSGNASSQKQKKAKRSPSTSNNAGSAAADAAGTSGGSDGSNGRSTTAAASHNGASAVGGAGNGNGSGGGGGNTSIPARSDVACKVKEDGKVSWILAKVSRYVSELKKYEVTDSGDDERVKKHMVFKKNIRVLPKKPFDFENKQRVLAVYPDTTVFYPATVTGRRGKHIQCLFDDEEDMMYPTKEVDARFVIHPESG
jgi:SGF29 tudor-like domain